jgi:Family of unknown function (DUF6074)
MSVEAHPQPTDLPAGQVVVFPANRRTGKIRRTAEVLSQRHGRAADRYWRQIIDGMASQMARAGFGDEVIRSEIRAFSDAVQRELQRGLS